MDEGVEREPDKGVAARERGEAGSARGTRTRWGLRVCETAKGWASERALEDDAAARVGALDELRRAAVQLQRVVVVEPGELLPLHLLAHPDCPLLT